MEKILWISGMGWVEQLSLAKAKNRWEILLHGRSMEMYLISVPDKEMVIMKLAIDVHNVVGVIPVFPNTKGKDIFERWQWAYSAYHMKCRKVGQWG